MTNRFLVVSLALVMGGAIMGIVMPVLLIYLQITSVEIAPGLDLLTILLPVAGLFDWGMAYYFWRLGKPPAERNGPVVG